jgi:predicted SprT family Zn-dependent metalloprotease
MKNLILNELKNLKKRYPYIKHSFKVSFNLTDFNTYGLYTPKNKILYFNLLVANKVGFNRFREVIVHEFVHYINDVKYTNFYHNKLWKDEMRFCGIVNPMATIDLNQFFIQKSSIKVKCDCSYYFISKNRFTRFKNGRDYRCSKCRGLIRES